MKRISTLLVVLCLALLPAASFAAGADKSLGMKQYTTVDDLAGAVSSYFPRVQGEVQAVQGTQVTVALGTKHGIVTGVTLSIWREGRELRHPVTDVVIGRAEDEVGSMEVTAAGETVSTGILLKKLLDPKPGDRARITPKRIGLGVLPLRAERPDIIQGLTDRLRSGTRFTLPDNDKLAAFLVDKKDRDAALIKEMGRVFGLDIVATVEIFPSDGKYLVTVRLFYSEDARPLDTLVALLDLRTKADVLGEVKPFFAPVPAKEEQAGIPDLPFDAQLMAAADLDGAGSQQYAFSDGSRVRVYRQEAGSWREVWAEKPNPGDGKRQIVNLDAADINGNGRAELFVTTMQNGKVASYVLECKDNACQRIADLPGFVRTLALPGAGTVLIGRAYDPKRFYTGPAYRYQWAAGAYTRGEELPLPEGLGLYGFTYAVFGEAGRFLVTVDDDDRLVVYSGGTPVWKSEQKYPSVGITVLKPYTGVDDLFSKQEEEADKSQKMRVGGRVLALDMNGDGRDEIVVPRNIGDRMFGGFTKGEFAALGWTGSRMEERWTIKDVAGVVMDFQLQQRTGAAPAILALVMTPGGLFAKDRLQVATYSAK